jgi:hypothetical protein
MNELRKFSAGLASLRLSVAFQWFLIALSVRPLSSLASAAHLLLCDFWACVHGACAQGVCVCVCVCEREGGGGRA